MTKSHKRSPRHLSDTALILLGAAADSENQMILPIPKSVRTRGNALERVLRSLLNQGFVEEVPVGLAEEAWRSDAEGRYGLRVTRAGLKAIGVPALASGLEAGPGTAVPTATHEQKLPRPGSKLARLITMLMKPDGRSVEELSEALGWQIHTTRAVLIIALEILAPRTTGLQSDTAMFLNFGGTTIVSAAILFIIVFYALREMARAEAASDRDYQRSESLLVNILPAPIAALLKRPTRDVIADKYDEASILFADMAGYTARSSDLDPNKLVQFLNRVFTDFDRLVEQHGLEKIKTTGDAYMVVSGVPSPRPDHVQALARLAIDMREAAAGLRDPDGHSVPIRIGIGIGPVVAGVVGTRKFFYDVWGDAVNFALRMESTGIEGAIQVSQGVYERLKGEFVLECRGEIEVKGKGRIPTWFLIADRAATAPPLCSAHLQSPSSDQAIS